MAAKAGTTKKPKARMKKGDAYECGVCGYRIIIDEACGCGEEHFFICCNKKMKKATRKK